MEFQMLHPFAKFVKVVIIQKKTVICFGISLLSKISF